MGLPLRLSCFLVAWWLTMPLARADEPPSGPFTQAQCVTCHETRSPKIVAQWRASIHAAATPHIDCVTCHGDRHDGAAARARHTNACTGCHGGPDGVVVQSYQLSKHGVIATLEEKRWDWTQPLADGNYRAPTCAYCHLHDGDHTMGGTAAVADALSDPEPTRREADQERRSEACRDCHSPRFSTTWFESGERMVAVARMKTREAAEVTVEIEHLGLTNTIQQEKNLLTRMIREHMRNVPLGVFHQSPDHQWWHGQPALDGDLLRLKGILGDARRCRALIERETSGATSPNPHQGIPFLITNRNGC